MIPPTTNIFFYRRVAMIVEKAARTWELYANIKFDFVTHRKSSEIRVLLCRIPQSRLVSGASVIGNDSTLLEKDKPTMFLGAGSRAESSRIRSTALHEFGHALGMIHEHTSPACKIEWNKNAVLNASHGDRKKADLNYLLQVDKSKVRCSKYDPKSIMVYNVPFNLMKNRVRTMRGRDLSDMDKEWASKFYPRKPSTPNTKIKSSTSKTKIKLSTPKPKIKFNQHSPHKTPKEFRCSADNCGPRRQCDKCYEKMKAECQEASITMET